jgi:hypothetical protein
MHFISPAGVTMDSVAEVEMLDIQVKVILDDDIRSDELWTGEALYYAALIEKMLPD